jgi:integrase/recombinase XerD
VSSHGRSESTTVLADGLVLDPVDGFLAHLTAIDRSPNTVRAYAHGLRDYFEFVTPPPG